MEKIRQSTYEGIHPDYKGKGDDGVHRILRMEDGGTVSVPVEVVDDYDPEALAALPTLAVGQDADLKLDHGLERVWLSRMGPEDGETHRVHVEHLVDGRWELAGKLHPLDGRWEDEEATP